MGRAGFEINAVCRDPVNPAVRRLKLVNDTGLFVDLAHIAAIFVGFGARISVKRRDGTNAVELGYVRGVASIADGAFKRGSSGTPEYGRYENSRTGGRLGAVGQGRSRLS